MTTEQLAKLSRFFLDLNFIALGAGVMREYMSHNTYWFITSVVIIGIWLFIDQSMWLFKDEEN